MSAGFAARLLRWYDRHGRHDLPWQRRRTPYRVWISEVMLQQTQVATVLPYFQRWMRALPSLRALAKAPEDQVLALWSGLGYYSRARNSHAAARRCLAEHAGRLPRDIEALTALPGIGRSTAAAILAQAHGERHAILDGNVKRVLARHAGVGGDVATSAVQATLWSIANARLPQSRLADYTQALMDLGATRCTPRRPDCAHCPLRRDCVARLENRIHELPARGPRRARPVRSSTMLLVRNDAGRVLLQRRPARGVWGGLWSLPECDTPSDAPGMLADRFELRTGAARPLPPIAHDFTHFRLLITPLELKLTAAAPEGADNAGQRWVARHELDRYGLPQPVRTLLESDPS